VPRWFSGADSQPRSGAIADRIELDNADLNHTMSAWYRLAYIDGGTRLQVFEHYAAATSDPESDLLQSEIAAWKFANEVLGTDADLTDLPTWARIRTGSDIGPSAGLMFTLAFIDLLTPGALVGDLRVAGTGGIGADGVVFPVSNVEVKVAAAVLTQPDVIFTPRPSKLIEDTTVVESEHTRNPADGYTVAEWLNLIGYQQAGRDASTHPGTVAYVVVHDIRQALAFLCGRTSNATTCALAQNAAGIPIGTL
jgi:predicted S18 family serine protease